MEENLCELSVKSVLEKMNLNGDISGNLYIHGAKMIDMNDPNSKAIIESFFSKGIKKQLKSILSTCLLLKDTDYSQQIVGYSCYGNCRVLVHIPENLDNIYLGHCLPYCDVKKNRSGTNHILDILDLTYIPEEFIVGVFYQDHSDFCYDWDNNSEVHFIQNPQYYELNERNKQGLMDKLKLAINSNIRAKLFMNLDDPSEKVKDIFQGYDIDKDLLYKRFLEEKEDFRRNLKIKE